MPLPHLGDCALRGDADDLREGEGADRLDQSCAADDERERHEQLGLALADHVVEQPLGRSREREPREPAHEHEAEADREVLPVRGDERPRLAPGGSQGDALLLGVRHGHRG